MTSRTFARHLEAATEEAIHLIDRLVEAATPRPREIWVGRVSHPLGDWAVMDGADGDRTLFRFQTARDAVVWARAQALLHPHTAVDEESVSEALRDARRQEFSVRVPSNVVPLRRVV